ncbi:MAG: NAD-glutamate dehydrogenase, partial [Deferribacterales bacterium]
DNIGLKVNEEDIFELSGENLFIHNIYLDCLQNIEEFYNNYNRLIPDLIKNVIKESVENDRLNKLLVSSKLNYREVDLLRSLRNYLEQANNQFKKNSIDDALLNNPKISALLVFYFNSKFDPALKERNLDPIKTELLEQIDSVVSAIEDRILRSFLEIISSMCRTNFFLNKDYISFKISSKYLSILPEPKPLYEIYVHSSKMEGIHLRGGKVARGGIRFSDRPDDFRTEILGLMKTQMVKNTVIVPVGSKGGFIVKKRYDDRELDKNHVIEQYKTLIKGLLDITDNYVGKKIVHPSNVVVYDQKDPYLVVAADKGTATFSDIANSVSLEYQFWLGDAFASGGSAGYDHKKVGITAKGAWECVKRHFRELGKDIQKEDFTVIGIGDMSGDVFGNGMLLSQKIKLIAAFNHIHIFVDPDPDPEISFLERKRLFNLPRSTWMDYNRSIISSGGGIFERSAKKITLTPEIKQLLKIDKDSVSGEELIKYILKSEAELLWNGGIGTYVKDSTETNEEVGDKLNDNVRVNAEELKVKVVGEGGNLGFTQKARIIFALLGGRINTDALDNSAGVDMSDHEVNLKILMEHLLKIKVIKDLKERNRLIAKLTPEVTDLVLRDNFEQSRIISIEEIKASQNILPYQEVANYLKDIGLLKFDIEKIEFIKESRNITRPELAVLLAYTKLYLYDQIVEDIDINNKIASSLYESYYPKTILEQYKNYIYDHKLLREITATVMVNKFINQNGITTFLKLYKTYGKSFSKIVERYFIANEIHNIAPIRKKIDELDPKSFNNGLYFALIELEKTLSVATEWLLHDNNYNALMEHLDTFKKIQNILPQHIHGNIMKSIKDFEQSLIDKRVSNSIVKDIVKIRFIKPIFDIFEITIKHNIEPEKLIKNYYLASDTLELKKISEAIKKITPMDQWDNINKENLLKKVKDIQKKIAYKSTLKDNWLKELINKEQKFFMNYFEFIKSFELNSKYTLIPFNVVLESLDKIIELW